MYNALINLSYLIASALFIFGLKGLTHPRTASRGNSSGAIGMLLAVVVTLIDRQIVGFEVILAGLIVGFAVGVILAVKIQMAAMPQMVALLNGFGGGASTLVAGAALIETVHVRGISNAQFSIATAASGIIGAVTFWGSLVAFAKLQEILSGRPVHFPGQLLVNGLTGLIAIVVGAWLVFTPDVMGLYWILVVISSILGILLVIPIGGADMPVAIALLNAYSGMAAAATGFVLNNNVLIITGSLVGASGIILTQIMCRAMNRSLFNVLMGAVGTGAGEGGLKEEAIYAGKVKSASPEEIAMLFDSARRVVIVPGYGMAVSQAQPAVRDLANLLESRGIEVEFAIHPVAGRMPGHMNVLLAEANIPYEKLKEMEEINGEFQNTDGALVIGANDGVTPAARNARSSPIYGMPILNVDQAKSIIVMKRSMNPGFAGIENELFHRQNTHMLFGDAKSSLEKLVGEVKN